MKLAVPGSTSEQKASAASKSILKSPSTISDKSIHFDEVVNVIPIESSVTVGPDEDDDDEEDADTLRNYADNSPVLSPSPEPLANLKAKNELNSIKQMLLETKGGEESNDEKAE